MTVLQQTVQNIECSTSEKKSTYIPKGRRISGLLEAATVDRQHRRADWLLVARLNLAVFSINAWQIKIKPVPICCWCWCWCYHLVLRKVKAGLRGGGSGGAGRAGRGGGRLSRQRRVVLTGVELVIVGVHLRGKGINGVVADAVRGGGATEVTGATTAATTVFNDDGTGHRGRHLTVVRWVFRSWRQAKVVV